MDGTASSANNNMKPRYHIERRGYDGGDTNSDSAA